jgi:cytochrome bd ubiquinol oxidase subunit II
VSAELVAWALLGCAVLYTLSGGADFGGGVWDLLAAGPRAGAQRRLITEAIAPIWEANHVWMIVIVVLLFTCFPEPFSVLSVTLHVPLTLALFGIVMRGSAFVFRQQLGYGTRWDLVFSIASLLTPVFLGMCVGAVASGAVPGRGGDLASLYLRPWLGPFPALLGGLTLALFAYLAAVYLCVEAEDAALREDFRARALVSGGAVGLLALGALSLSRREAPFIHEGLTAQWWSLPFQAATGTLSVAA